MTSAVDPRPAREPNARGQRPEHEARTLTAGGPDAEIVLDGQR